MHGTLFSVLRCLGNPDQGNWDLMLPYATHAINTSVSETTGFTPFYLLYGREPFGLVDIVVENTPENLARFQWWEALRAARAVAARRDAQARGVQEDRDNVPDVLQVGDLVLVKFTRAAPGKSKKLLPKQQGPYRVTAIRDGTTVQLQSLKDPGDTLERHASLLVRFHGDPAIGDDEWEIDEILDEKMVDGVPHYLVHWKGYPSEENSWLPVSRLDDEAGTNTLLIAWRKDKGDKGKEEEKISVERIISSREEDGVTLYQVAEEDAGPSEYLWVTAEQMSNPEVLENFHPT